MLYALAMRAACASIAVTTIANGGVEIPDVSIRSIRTPDGYQFLRPLDINDHGDIVGEAIDDGGITQPFLVHHERGFEILEVLNPHLGASALSINNDGVVIGNSIRSSSGNQRIAIWTSDGMLSEQFPGGAVRGRAINNNGVIVGFDEHAERPFTWTAKQGTEFLPSGGVGKTADALQIEDDGSVLGWSETTALDQAAGVWTSTGSFRYLADEFGKNQRGKVYDSNSSGSFVGELGKRPVYWDSISSAPVSVNVFDRNGTAVGINEDGLIVGTTVFSDEQTNERAFIWSPSEGLFDLSDKLSPDNAALWFSLDTLTAINAVDQFVGFGNIFLPDGSTERRIYVATIPTPGTAPLALVFLLLPLRKRRSL